MPHVHRSRGRYKAVIKRIEIHLFIYLLKIHQIMYDYKLNERSKSGMSEALVPSLHNFVICIYSQKFMMKYGFPKRSRLVII